MLGRKSASDPDTTLVEGMVKKWVSGTGKKGPYSWGFIDVGDGKDVFVHGPTHGLESLKEGQRVEVAFKDVTVEKTGNPGRTATKVVLA
jgi:cold shock CspA family protein